MYEYFSGGMGWSEIPRIGAPQGGSHKFGLCSDWSKNRQVCFIDNDPLEQATAERAGCVQSRRPWYQPSDVTECRTRPGNNPGHVWCCPENAPRPVPTTPEQRARATELVVAEQQAEDQGTLPVAPTSSEPIKEPMIDPGQTGPVSQQVTMTATLTKLRQNSAWIVAALALGTGGYLAYRYFTRPRVRSMRRTAALAGVR